MLLSLAVCSSSMQHDVGMRAAARVIYEAVYPSEDRAPLGFDEAERLRYREAVDAPSRVADCLLFDSDRQLALLCCGAVHGRPADRGSHLRGSRLALRHQGHLRFLWP